MDKCIQRDSLLEGTRLDHIQNVCDRLQSGEISIGYCAGIGGNGPQISFGISMGHHSFFD